MARAARTKLPQPVFHEPIFGEDGSLPDPTGFSTRHGSDNALYKQIGDLTTKDVVPIPKSRIADDKMYSLADAYGSHGAEIVKKITADPAYEGIVRTCVSLARELNLKVVAEGVETEPQAAALRALGCDQAQGFLYSPPVPADQLVRMLATEPFANDRG